MKYLLVAERVALYGVFAFVVLGSLVVIYYQNFDGSNPVTFNVDIQAFKTDKSVYHAGDVIKIYSSFCIHRSMQSDTTWRILNQTVITYPLKTTLMKVGCSEGWFPIAPIPTYFTPGEHHLEGIANLHVNGLRTIEEDFRSVDFEVI